MPEVTVAMAALFFSVDNILNSTPEAKFIATDLGYMVWPQNKIIPYNPTDWHGDFNVDCN